MKDEPESGPGSGTASGMIARWPRDFSGSRRFWLGPPSSFIARPFKLRIWHLLVLVLLVALVMPLARFAYGIPLLVYAAMLAVWVAVGRLVVWLLMARARRFWVNLGLVAARMVACFHFLALSVVVALFTLVLVGAWVTALVEG